MNDIRVVVDTNIIIRAVSGRSLTNFVFDYLFHQNYTLCVSTEILLEYEEKLIQIYDEEVAELIISALTVLPNILKTDIYFNLQLIANDADDDKFVNCAFASNAHFIASDDKHFDILSKIDFPKINVLKYSEFRDFLLRNE